MHEVEDLKYRYEVGTVVCSKEDPQRKLLIMKHAKGIYYCAVIGNAAINNVPFFESQLTSFEK
jgi:hypothetical protein